MKERERTVEVFVQYPFNGLVFADVTGCPEGCTGKKINKPPKNGCPLNDIKDKDTNPKVKAKIVKLGQCNGSV
ncbi:hypothetical protein C4559_02735 [Candidatus Microgenomates bacterium]|nr:MAG: hypothetical protein C4559_02735 [Candidatus Microgenomates bacterium]